VPSPGAGIPSPVDGRVNSGATTSVCIVRVHSLSLSIYLSIYLSFPIPIVRGHRRLKRCIPHGRPCALCGAVGRSAQPVMARSRDSISAGAAPSRRGRRLRSRTRWHHCALVVCSHGASASAPRQRPSRRSLPSDGEKCLEYNGACSLPR
jgi:hypothetical protein